MFLFLMGMPYYKMTTEASITRRTSLGFKRYKSNSTRGTDDTIIYHLLCLRHGLEYKPYEEVNVWRDEATGEIKSERMNKPNPNYVPKA